MRNGKKHTYAHVIKQKCTFWKNKKNEEKVQRRQSKGKK